MQIEHLLDAIIGRGDVRRRRERIVRFEVDHRPHRDSERAERLLQHRELRLEQRIDAGAVLVRLPEIVAERLDHVVGRDTEVRRAVLEHAEHGLHDRARTADLDPVRIEMPGPRREVLPEELIGPVDEMHTHGTTLSRGCD